MSDDPKRVLRGGAALKSDLAAPMTRAAAAVLKHFGRHFGAHPAGIDEPPIISVVAEQER